MSPFAAVTLQAQLNDQLARVNQGGVGSKPNRPALDLCCSAEVYRSWKDKQYRANLNKASRLLSKDLDLVQFVSKKKRIWMATFAMLDKQHRLVIRDLSKL